jgi:hypothetical protein
MDWEAIGAVGEVAGALGVIVTLGFLVFQLRQNTRALKSDGFYHVAQMIHHPTTLIIQDPELADIHLRGNEDYESLGDVERDRYHYLMVQRIHAIEMLKQFEKAGTADDWFADSGFEIVVRLGGKPGFRQWWAARGHILFGAEFNSKVQRIVNENSN